MYSNPPRMWAAGAQLLLLVLLLEFLERIGGVAVACGHETAELVSIVGVDGELHELVGGITAPPIGQTPQLGDVPGLSRKFHELVDRVGVAALGAAAQLIQVVRIAHVHEAATVSRMPHAIRPIDQKGDRGIQYVW